jgi:galactokinase
MNPKAGQHFKVRLHAPGRINLIGEHTDYNLGFVLPAATNLGLEMHLTRSESPGECTLRSTLGDQRFQFNLQDLPSSGKGWETYILGVVQEIGKLRPGLQGFDCVISSNLPTGAGLSSSAALTCGLATGLNTLFDLELDQWEIIKLSQASENLYAGTRCGIMDPFASVMGRKDHFVFLDCRSLTYEYIPANLEGHELILLNSGVTHALAESGYNERRAACEQGVERLQRQFPKIQSLRDVTERHLVELKPGLPTAIERQCRYVLRENERVLQAVMALKNGDMPMLGNLLYTTHLGLQNEYQVSCKELDFLVDQSREHPEVAGARMMGGGFGGCSLTLIRKGESLQFFQRMASKYRTAFDRELRMIPVKAEAGVRILY